ncbi:MAG TPA: carboxypeptidase-like regulatory domain-containing protein, partial [Mucilaginibacter sp.]|nr:carboxypeptidase-like regulatory domain-containing protein [Mucilaginibacter sp.]
MRKILRIALLFVCCILVAAVANAQDTGTLIRGTVTDDQGVTLPGVTVTAKNVNAITGANGNYLIRVP